ncbi:hypothetical protein [Novosphingobium sp. 18052]|uniref:hypothetical protein n=1 Tax=Novosphingobium sp. 18052 TaxID=2681400 RepID=UPI001359BBD1|nr:hypothetical protein [Novosphingobium sp. 18052]
MVPYITDEMIIGAMESYPFAGWPKDEAEMAALFNFLLRDLLLDRGPTPSLSAVA